MPNRVRGVAPGLILVPAREYEWELVQKVTINVPNKGRITDFLNEQELADGIKLPGDDEFVILEDNLLLLWEIVRVLFAKAKYPNLEDDQCLNVTALEFEGEDVVLHGEILKYV